MGNWTGMGNGNENLGKSSTGRDETTAREILELGLAAILFTYKGAQQWTLSFTYHLVLQSTLWDQYWKWIHLSTLTEHLCCNHTSLTSLTTLAEFNPSLVPRHGGEGGERVPGTQCLRMRLIATEFCGNRVCMCMYV